jgi:hypothetical protein
MNLVRPNARSSSRTGATNALPWTDTTALSNSSRSSNSSPLMRDALAAGLRVGGFVRGLPSFFAV